MKPNPAAVPELWLEQYHLGELAEPQRGALEAQLAGDPALRARLDALAADDEATLAAHPPAAMQARLSRRLAATHAERRRRWLQIAALAAPAMAAATVLVVVLVAGPGEDRALPLPPESTRIKGQTPSLSVHRQRGGDSERLADGAAVQAHDLVQLSYVAAGRAYGVIVSIDGRGAVTIHHPTRPGGDHTLLVGGEAALPNAYELDDAPGFERFFFVTSAEPIDDRAVVAAAEALARAPARAATEPLPLPAPLEQTTVLLRKEEVTP